MFRKILIANRGEIAVRVARTAREMGIASVAVHSDADARALHVEAADEAVRIGPAPAAESYLKVDAIVEACRATGAEAVHPGYGFLSENPALPRALEAAGLTFIGPSAEAIDAMGLKDAAKRAMEAAGVPVVPGYHGEAQDAGTLKAEAEAIGYPVLIKARAGGGGKGMRRVDDPGEFADALEGAQREGEASFGDPRVLIEKYVDTPRHVEVQVLGDSHGHAVHLFERDCSLQRRHQKVIEEAPAPGMSAGMRAAMGEAAVRAALAIGYEGAGTVEFIADASEGLRTDRFYFMEMNTRLQVEHPVTEAITGLDLVELQIRVAAGEALPFEQDMLTPYGHAMEARVYAEDPARGFLPATGTLHRLSLPDGIARVDSGVREGDAITPHYDPMIAKVIVHEETREEARAALAHALGAARVAGTTTNLPFLQRLVDDPDFAAGDVDTGLIARKAEALTAPEPLAAEAVALAAIAALGLPRAPASDDPWEVLTGWRAWGAAQQIVRLEGPDGAIEARVTLREGDRYTVRWGTDAAVSLHLMGGRAEIDGVVKRWEVARHPAGQGRGLTVFVDGGAWSFRLPDPTARAEEAGGDSIAAPMPGLVKALRAGAGDTVTKGQPLAVLEAMKMEHTLKAPRDGTVAEVRVAQGDQVEDGAVLMTLEAQA